MYVDEKGTLIDDGTFEPDIEARLAEIDLGSRPSNSTLLDGDQVQELLAKVFEAVARDGVAVPRGSSPPNRNVDEAHPTIASLCMRDHSMSLALPPIDDGCVRIFDTTLRDGEQSPGGSMTTPEKLRVARVLSELEVDVIEAGFPASSPGDFEAVRTIAREIGGVTICGLARCDRRDIDRAWEALKHAEAPRIHVFLGTSPIHRRAKLNLSPADVIRSIERHVAHAKQYCEDVEFSAEDAARTEPDFLCEVIETAVAAGATTINIPDTVGYSTPTEFAGIVRNVRQRVAGIERVVLSVHCHDDLGMAVANSLVACEAGARQVECTINGIGERAGNAALEEVVMALDTRREHFGLYTGVRTEMLYPASIAVSTVTGLVVPRNKAIVGRNAFSHEAGIHQDGMIKDRTTYEIIRPEKVGMKTDLVLGKHSGKRALRKVIEGWGHHIDDHQLVVLFHEFKTLADVKKQVYEEDLIALYTSLDEAASIQPAWELVSVHASTIDEKRATATVCMKGPDEVVHQDAAIGDGPFDATFKAIERITMVGVEIKSLRIESISEGRDAQSEAVLVVRDESGSPYGGRAVSTDSVRGAALAFLKAVNKVHSVQSSRITTEEVIKLAFAKA